MKTLRILFATSLPSSIRFFASALILFLFLAFSGEVSGQILLDNYDGVGDLTYTTEGTWVITGGQYEGQTGSATTPEHSYASYDLINSISAWDLNRAKGNVWFGWMDLNRVDVSGWGGNNYSCGMVLAANSSDFNASTTSGIAIGFNSTDGLVLFRFSAGIVSGTEALPGTSTTIVASGYTYANADNGVNFFVEYLSDGKWAIYFRAGAKLSDADATNKANYNGGSATSAVADNTHTGTTFKHAGWIYAHGSAAADKAFFDNFGAGQAVTTLVTLQSFVATSLKSGNLLKWKTGFEVNNLGFNIYRERNGKRVLINKSLISGSALMAAPGTGMTASNSYKWTDPKGTADSVYYLEDVDLNGSSTMHDAVTPSPDDGESASFSKEEQSPLLGELNDKASEKAKRQDSQRGWAAPMVSTETPKSGSGGGAKLLTPGQLSGSGRNSDQSSGWSENPTITNKQSDGWQKALAAMPALKIAVRHTGWYRIGQPALAAGFKRNVDRRNLQLYADGVEVPIKINSDKTSGPLKPGDSIEFFGIGLDTTATDARQYWLISGITEGKRINPEKLSSVSQGGVLPSFDYTIERKERTIYFSGLLNGETENFFGKVVNNTAVTQTLALKHLNATSTVPAQLEIALQGVTLLDHVVKVLVNGTEVGVLNFAGQANQRAQLSIAPGLLHDGDNTVTLQSLNGSTDISLVDNLRLTYARSYQADNDYLHFTLNGRAQVSGFSVPDVMLLDITEPNSVRLYKPKTEAATGGYRFTVETSQLRVFIALTNHGAEEASSITPNKPSNWGLRVNGADFVVITHRNFRKSVEPLAQLRRNQGMSVAVIDVEDVYDEFSYGAHSPHAIREFLKWAATNWLVAPRFVLLAGDGSYDPRNYLGGGDTDLVPTRLIDTALLETASDDWFVDFNDDGIAEMAIGRLPVRTAAEADIMISKIVNYSPANAAQNALMVADKMDTKTNFNFEAASNQLSALLPATISVQKVFRGDNAPSVVHDQIVSGINQGPLLVNFLGHGSVEVWTGAPILSTLDAAAFNNGPRLPVFFTMTCLNGYYQNPARESMAESFLRTGTGGAVAVWASSGMTSPEPQFQMNSALYEQLFGNQPLTLGEAIRNAKAGSGDRDVLRTWILFGDPTMKLR